MVTRASFTAQLQLQHEADRDYVRGVNFVENPNPFGVGPEIGFGTDLTLDHGPAFYALMAPFVAFIPSPMALVAVQATIFGLGLVALGLLAWRKVGLLGATLAALVWLSSNAALSEWEENLWHCSALPGLLFIHFALADRFWQRPSGGSLFAFLVSGSVAVQVYTAAAGVVLPSLWLTGIALWRRRLRRLPAITAVAGALVISLPFLVRLAITLPSARFVDTPDATHALSDTLGDAALAVTRLAEARWTIYAGRLPSVMLIGAGLVLLVAVPLWRLWAQRNSPAERPDGTFRTYLLMTGLLICATGAWAYRERSQERYLIAVLPTLLALAVEGGAAACQTLNSWLVSGTSRVSRAWMRWARPASSVAACALALALWLPAATGGVRDTALLPPPGDGTRVGNDFRLGLGETLSVLEWLHETVGIGWPDTCAVVHGRFCQPSGGVPGAAVTNFVAVQTRRTPDHVVVLTPDSGARCPTDRRVSEATFPGAYGRTITACRFRPAILATEALVESRPSTTAPFRHCKTGIPLDATWNSWGPEARDASNLWPGDNRHFRDDDACAGPSYRAFIPLIDAAGTVAIEVTFEGAHEALVATIVHLGTATNPPARLELTPTSDGGAVTGIISWAAPTRGLLITFDGPGPLLRFDVY